MDNLSQWCFQISRSIFDSTIFSKPSDWLKVWIYIIWNVNFKDNWLPRWSWHFKYEWIERDCKVKYNIVTKICQFLKNENQISVKKATHWCVITVLNYAVYQWLSNYEGKTEARQRQDRGKIGVDNIKKNERMKEWKKEENSFQEISFDRIEEISNTLTNNTKLIFDLFIKLWRQISKEETAESFREWFIDFVKTYIPNANKEAVRRCCLDFYDYWKDRKQKEPKNWKLTLKNSPTLSHYNKPLWS